MTIEITTTGGRLNRHHRGYAFDLATLFWDLARS